MFIIKIQIKEESSKMGKRKIVIEKLENPEKIQITFSKRRKGLFQKAADTCKLCNAEIAIVAFSPAGKPYTFGHSSVDSVIDRYLSGSHPVAGNDIGEEHSRLHGEIKELKKKNLNAASMKGDPRSWLEQIMIDVEEYHSVEELQAMVDGLEKLRSNVLKRLPNTSAEAETQGDQGVGTVEAPLHIGADAGNKEEGEKDRLLSDDYWAELIGDHVHELLLPPRSYTWAWDDSVKEKSVMGKRKIAIEKLESPDKRQVTFSKRRQGLFQKAAEACMLCDAEIAVVAFSPAGNPYSFGHSSVDSVIDRYLYRSTSDPVAAGNDDREEHSRLQGEVKELECKLKRKKQLCMKGDPRSWLEQIDVDQEYHSVEELEAVVDRLEKLRSNVLKRLPNNTAEAQGGGGGVEAPLHTGAAPTHNYSIVDQTAPWMVNGFEAAKVANAENDQFLSDDYWAELIGDHVLGILPPRSCSTCAWDDSVTNSNSNVMMVEPANLRLFEL
ncbi:hypothetical protein HHK36_026296 [Tetracentron sinense]|uniref:MADS-box domain-containing protein n=1 Tax=Tetracentron sinense TaxID=13715 RepID=A0A835D228_TETSI|nr:hypothetical protein HHK36_026296 [Tetracentron sinense]